MCTKNLLVLTALIIAIKLYITANHRDRQYDDDSNLKFGSKEHFINV